MTRSLIIYSALISLLKLSDCAAQNIVNTVSGNGSPGFTNGTINIASFSSPFGICIDQFNNLYIADGDNNCIRKINTSTWQVTTFAGTGVTGWLDGPADSARFNSPSDLCIDNSGNVYVSDFLNQRIRKISSNGIVSTIAGNGIAGYTDGNPATAKFNFPRGICRDRIGNLYIGDSWNHRIRKIDTAGVVSTYAGGGIIIGLGSTGAYVDANDTSARFYTPSGLAIDQSGNIFVADAYNHRIREIDTGRVVTTISGTGATGPGNGGFQNGNSSSAIYNTPTELFVDTTSHSLYISDTFNNRIRKVEFSNNSVTTYAGNGVAGFIDGTDSMASFNFPRGIVSDNTGQYFYVVDYNNHAIRLIFPKNPSGINEAQRNISPFLYPCPATNQIILTGIDNSASEAAIFDSDGKKIMEFSNVKDKTSFDISCLTNGFYIMKIYSPSGNISRSFLKEN